MAFKRRGQTLAVEAAAGRLTGTNLTVASNTNPRYLAALTAAPTGEDPTSIAEGTGTNLRPQITWGTTNAGATPVEITNSGELFIGPFSAPATITHIALVLTTGTIVAGTVIAVAAITPRSVASGDRLRFAIGNLKISVT